MRIRSCWLASIFVVTGVFCSQTFKDCRYGICAGHSLAVWTFQSLKKSSECVLTLPAGQLIKQLILVPQKHTHLLLDPEYRRDGQSEGSPPDLNQWFPFESCPPQSLDRSPGLWGSPLTCRVCSEHTQLHHYYSTTTVPGVLDRTIVRILVPTVVVVPLWDVEHVLWFWAVQDSSINRPQSTEDPKQWALPAAIWTRDQHIHALIHLRHRE